MQIIMTKEKMCKKNEITIKNKIVLNKLYSNSKFNFLLKTFCKIDP